MGDCVNVKSLDNRAGCYVLIEALRAIKASRKNLLATSWPPLPFRRKWA